MGLLLTEQLLPHRVLTQRDTAHRHNDCSQSLTMTQTETLLTDRDTARTEQLLTQDTAHRERVHRESDCSQGETAHTERLLAAVSPCEQSLSFSVSRQRWRLKTETKDRD